MSRLISNEAHACLILPDLASADFLLCAPNAREDDVPQNCDPMHTVRGQVLYSTIEGVVGVRSQTLKQRHPRLARLLHVAARMLLEDRGSRSDLLGTLGGSSHVIIAPACRG